jgi:hypothetical protein
LDTLLLPAINAEVDAFTGIEIDFKKRLNNGIYLACFSQLCSKWSLSMTPLIDLQINTHLIPTQGVFFDGQVFDAYH